jgi:hypothetical protein
VLWTHSTSIPAERSNGPNGKYTFKAVADAGNTVVETNDTGSQHPHGTVNKAGQSPLLNKSCNHSTKSR